MSLVIEHLEYLHSIHAPLNTGMREICFNHDEDTFTEEGFIIENIYTEILPIYIELFRSKLEDMLIKDNYGNLTLLWVG